MNYIIPVRLRELNISQWGSKVAYVDVFGKGVKVIYSKPDFDLSPLNINNSYIIGISDQYHRYVEAETPRAALEKFYKDYEDATSCGLESQAMEISKREPIEELPSCPFMKFNKNGNTVCVHGDEEEFNEREADPDENNVYGCGCVIDGADYGPDICPIENTWKMFEYDFTVEEIDGFKFKRLNKEAVTSEQVALKKIPLLKEESAVSFGSSVAEEFHNSRKQFHKLKKIFKENKIEWPK